MYSVKRSVIFLVFVNSIGALGQKEIDTSEEKCMSETANHNDEEKWRLEEGEKKKHQEPIFEWTLWSIWSDCSVTCGNGLRIRTRKCNESLLKDTHTLPTVWQCETDDQKNMYGENDYRNHDEEDESCHYQSCIHDQTEAVHTLDVNEAIMIETVGEMQTESSHFESFDDVQNENSFQNANNDQIITEDLEIKSEAEYLSQHSPQSETPSQDDTTIPHSSEPCDGMNSNEGMHHEEMESNLNGDEASAEFADGTCHEEQSQFKYDENGNEDLYSNDDVTSEEKYVDQGSAYSDLNSNPDENVDNEQIQEQIDVEIDAENEMTNEEEVIKENIDDLMTSKNEETMRDDAKDMNNDETIKEEVDQNFDEPTNEKEDVEEPKFDDANTNENGKNDHDEQNEDQQNEKTNQEKQEGENKKADDNRNDGNEDNTDQNENDNKDDDNPDGEKVDEDENDPDDNDDEDDDNRQEEEEEIETDDLSSDGEKHKKKKRKKKKKKRKKKKSKDRDILDADEEEILEKDIAVSLKVIPPEKNEQPLSKLGSVLIQDKQLQDSECCSCTEPYLPSLFSFENSKSHTSVCTNDSVMHSQNLLKVDSCHSTSSGENSKRRSISDSSFNDEIEVDGILIHRSDSLYTLNNDISEHPTENYLTDSSEYFLKSRCYSSSTDNFSMSDDEPPNNKSSEFVVRHRSFVRMDSNDSFASSQFEYANDSDTSSFTSDSDTSGSSSSNEHSSGSTASSQCLSSSPHK